MYERCIHRSMGSPRARRDHSSRCLWICLDQEDRCRVGEGSDGCFQRRWGIYHTVSGGQHVYNAVSCALSIAHMFRFGMVILLVEQGA
jgi:hypothetical protein